MKYSVKDAFFSIGIGKKMVYPSMRWSRRHMSVKRITSNFVMGRLARWQPIGRSVFSWATGKCWPTMRSSFNLSWSFSLSFARAIFQKRRKWRDRDRKGKADLNHLSLPWWFAVALSVAGGNSRSLFSNCSIFFRTLFTSSINFACVGKYSLYSLANMVLLSSGKAIFTAVSFLSVQSNMPMVGFSSGVFSMRS